MNDKIINKCSFNLTPQNFASTHQRTQATLLNQNHTARLTAINDRKEGTYGYLSHPIRRSAYPSHRLSDGVAIQAA